MAINSYYQNNDDPLNINTQFGPNKVNHSQYGMNTFFGGYPNPCCCGCILYFSDTFNRANSGDIGQNWEEVVGEWSISGNRLVESGNPGAVAIVTGVQSITSSHFAECDVIQNSSGEAHDVIVNYVDEDNYCWASLLREPYTTPIPGYHELSLHQKSSTGGANALFVTVSGVFDTEVDLYDLEVVFNSGIFCARSDDGLNRLEAQTNKHIINTNGKMVGLGNSSQVTTPIQFDSFVFSDEFLRHSECPQCGCICDGHGVSQDLLLSIYATGACSGLDGISFPMRNDADLASPGWVGYTDDQTGVADGCLAHPAFFNLRCGVIESGCNGFILGTDGNALEGCAAGYVGGFPVSCECEPFHLVFPEENMGESYAGTCCCCPPVDEDPDAPPYSCDGVWWVEITETG
jgi:hypothetical protein